ncbi:MAG: D-glycerate dehydrogenase [Chloroflexi bacterium]|nr:D-glycerate dehydrogenase [Chloroflexota bacterium]
MEKQKPRVYVTRIIAEKALDLLRAECEVKVWQGSMPPPRDVLLEEVQQIDGLVSLLTDRVDEELLSRAAHLKVVSNVAVGYDNIDVNAATRHGIPIGNTPGVLTETTADLAFALMMAAARRLGESERYIRDGKWQTWDPTALLGVDIYGTTLGIIGMGRIGQAVAKRARGFDMRVIYSGGGHGYPTQLMSATRRELDELLQESDFVSIHCPLRQDTYHLIGERELSLMKPTAILVNTARGGIVDPKALYTALKNKQIGYAALDVTEPEPIHLDDLLLTLDNCLIVPHIGSASVRTREKMALMAVENLLAGLRGDRLPHCVNPSVYNR